MSKARLYQVTATYLRDGIAKRTDIHLVAANTRQQAEKIVLGKWAARDVLHLETVCIPGGSYRRDWRIYSISASSEK